jgi:hypothetical protein
LAVGLVCAFLGGLTFALEVAVERAKLADNAPPESDATRRADAQLRGYLIAARFILPYGVASVLVAIAREL